MPLADSTKVAVPTSEDPDMTDRTVIIRSQGLSWLFLRMPDGSVAKRAGYLSKDKSLVTMHWEAHSHLLCHLQKFQRPLLGSEAFIHMTYMCTQMAHVAHIHTQTHSHRLCTHAHIQIVTYGIYACTQKHTYMAYTHIWHIYTLTFTHMEHTYIHTHGIHP